MYSITKVLAATAMLSGFSMAAPHNVHGSGPEWASDEQPALAARGWPDEKYSTTKMVTTTPASCFSTPSSKVVKCSTTTPYVAKTETKCWTKTICSETTKMVKGTPIVVKQTSFIPLKPIYTPAPPPNKPKTWKPAPSPTPKLSTSCRTLYTTIDGKPTSTTQKIISVITSTWTPEAPKSTPSSSSSCKKTSTPLLWFPDGSTSSYPAVTSPVSKSSAPSSKASITSPAKTSSAQISSAKATSSSKAISSKASNSTTKPFTMPTHGPLPTMESSASSLGGVSIVLSAIAAVALVMAAL